jgi:hypothetical protein
VSLVSTNRTIRPFKGEPACNSRRASSEAPKLAPGDGLMSYGTDPSRAFCSRTLLRMLTIAVGTVIVHRPGVAFLRGKEGVESRPLCASPQPNHGVYTHSSLRPSASAKNTA